MYGAIILALLIADNWQETMQPSEAEVQAAMSARWVMISSIGDDNRDYAVRNLSCGKSEPFVEPPETEDGNKPTEEAGGIAADIAYRFRDIAQFTVRCSFEAAGVWRNPREPRKLELLGKGVFHTFSERDLRKISAAAWRQEDHTFVYIARGHCRFMGRTPKEGECYNWVINLGASLAAPNADTLIKPRVRRDCRYLSRTPKPGECLNLTVESNSPAAPITEPEMYPIASHVWPGPSAPKAPDIQMALARNWLAHSSGGGTSLSDSAVRNIACGPISMLPTAIPSQDKFETWTYQANCSFEYAKVLRKPKYRDTAIKPRIFSSHELKDIDALSWRRTQQDIVYAMRNNCEVADKEQQIGNCNSWIFNTLELL